MNKEKKTPSTIFSEPLKGPVEAKIKDLLPQLPGAPSDMTMRERLGRLSARLYPSLRPFAKYVTTVDEQQAFIREMARLVYDKKAELDGKERPIIVAIGGRRGATKSGSSDGLVAELGRRGLKAKIVHMDSYFKEDVDPGSMDRWDNPYNSDLELAASALKSLRKGMPAKILDRENGTITGQKVSPKEFQVIIVEGLHALNLKISKHCDVRAFIHVAEGLQFERVLKKDMNKPSTFEKRATWDYRIGMSERSNRWFWRFTWPRIKKGDADVLYVVRPTERDVDRIVEWAGMQARKAELMARWKVEPDH